MVGIRTSIAMAMCSSESSTAGRSLASSPNATGGQPRSFRVNSYLFLGHRAVHDPEGAELLPAGLSCRNQNIMRARLTGIRNVSPGRVGLGRGMRVIDHNGLFVPFVHLPPHLQLFK